MSEFNELMHDIHNPVQGTEVRLDSENYMFDADEFHGAGAWINITQLEESVNEHGTIISDAILVSKEDMIELGYNQFKSYHTIINNIDANK